MTDLLGSGGTSSATTSSLGSKFGLTDDEYNTTIKVGDRPHMTTVQMQNMTPVDLPDGTRAYRPSGGTHNMQEHYLDANGNMQTRDAMRPNGTEPIPAKIGDEIQRYSDMAFSSDPAERQKFKDLQAKLKKGGFLSNDYTDGIPDNATIDGLTKAMQTAVRGKVTLDEALDTADKNNAGKSKSNAHAYKLTSPTDVKAAILASAPQLIGHGVDQDTINRITAGFNSLEANSQKATYDAQDANDNGGGPQDSTVSYSAPDIAAYTAEQLRQSDPAAAQGQQLGHFFSEFLGMMRGGSSGSSSFGGNIQNANG